MYKNNAENLDPTMLQTKNNRAMLLSKFAVCGSEKSRYMKEKEASRLLSSLGIRVPLRKILLLGKILFNIRYDNFSPQRRLKTVYKVKE